MTATVRRSKVIYMNTTTCPIPIEVESLIEDALDTFINSAPGEFSLTVGELLNMDEDEMVERFGPALSDRLCDLEICGEAEWVQTCCVTFNCPGDSTLSGGVSVWNSGSQRDLADSTITGDGFFFGPWK